MPLGLKPQAIICRPYGTSPSGTTCGFSRTYISVLNSCLELLNKEFRLDNKGKLFLPYQILREERLNMNQEKDDFVMLKTIDPQPVQSPETSC